MNSVSPWLVLAGLGAFHGLNPAMGWLFAVALGLHRKSRKIVLMSLAPIAIGHTVSIAVVAVVVVALGFFVDQRPLEIAAGVLLIGWAIYHMAYGHRHRVRIGMQTGMAGLGVWSFLMASAHGAGLMLVPVLIPLCLSGSPAQELTAAGSLPIALAAVGTHMAAMLAVILAIAISVYEWLGLSFLRRGWINLDLIWTAALVITGLILIM
ncbi:hypothetical protein SAMN04488498_101622 [Mesorhizobium albiziae]|uniref:Arginine/ornithine antiporter ArcD n=1 Tax=Neomesorhizobium albiziae TaxID=335020 RepID=A0A1I3VPY1_9HYPH|nr:hypothetical protein [Mesorhizobium albiziae]GLS29078.1 hypothetical protein GCM10007937_07850 [Mesorhizobium albiziae]SFJ97003.1 hypothetical protein SAMN04488498_101622 [Mesorhizobium albiziae]